MAYELGLLVGNRIYLVISIAYLTRYYASDDPYNRIPLLLGLMEYGTESDSISSDDERDGKRWELERVVDYKNKRGKIWYLVRWKGYGPQWDSWKESVVFKYARQLLNGYCERFQRQKKLG